MADVTGPISSLPYSQHDTPEGTVCDDHPDRPAVVRIQGETDSFGSEMHDCCQECADAIKAERNSPEARTGMCDWCKKEATDLRPKRDYEEGMSGRVYDVCGDCVRKEDEECRAEIEEYEHRYGYDADDDYDLDDDNYDAGEWNNVPACDKCGGQDACKCSDITTPSRTDNG